MSQVSEIKCPSCGKWSTWTGKVGNACPYCHAHFNPARLEYEEQRKLTTERNKENSYLIIKPTDDPLVQMFKQFVNWLRWGTFYGISVIYVLIGIVVVLYGLVML